MAKTNNFFNTPAGQRLSRIMSTPETDFINTSAGKRLQALTTPGLGEEAGRALKGGVKDVARSFPLGMRIGGAVAGKVEDAFAFGREALMPDLDQAMKDSAEIVAFRESWPFTPPREKGPGFLGTLQRPKGGISTELSIGIDIDGEETEIPLLVPTLSQPEIDSLLSSNIDPSKIPDGIVSKAVSHAKERIQQGKSPFKQKPSFRPVQEALFGAAKTIDTAIEEFIPESTVAPSPAISKSILQEPSLLLSPRWWTYNTLRALPGMVFTAVPGFGAGSIAYKAGIKAGANPATAAWLMRLGTAIGVVPTAGSIESVSIYDELKERGVSDEEAAQTALYTTMGIGVLNVLPFYSAMSGIGSKPLKIVMTSALEAVQEMAEEPLQEFAIKGKVTGESLERAINVAPIAAFLGVVMGGAGIVATPTTEQKNDAKIIRDAFKKQGEVKEGPTIENGFGQLEKYPELKKQYEEGARILGLVDEKPQGIVTLDDVSMKKYTSLKDAVNRQVDEVEVSAADDIAFYKVGQKVWHTEELTHPFPSNKKLGEPKVVEVIRNIEGRITYKFEGQEGYIDEKNVSPFIELVPPTTQKQAAPEATGAINLTPPVVEAVKPEIVPPATTQPSPLPEPVVATTVETPFAQVTPSIVKGVEGGVAPALPVKLDEMPPEFLKKNKFVLKGNAYVREFSRYFNAARSAERIKEVYGNAWAATVIREGKGGRVEVTPTTEPAIETTISAPIRFSIPATKIPKKILPIYNAIIRTGEKKRQIYSDVIAAINNNKSTEEVIALYTSARRLDTERIPQTGVHVTRQELRDVAGVFGETGEEGGIRGAGGFSIDVAPAFKGFKLSDIPAPLQKRALQLAREVSGRKTITLSQVQSMKEGPEKAKILEHLRKNLLTRPIEEEGLEREANIESVTEPRAVFFTMPSKELGKIEKEVRLAKTGKTYIRGKAKVYTDETTKRLQTDGHAVFFGVKINTPYDVAILAQTLRNSAYETSRVLYLKNNRVVHYEGVSAKLPTITPTFMQVGNEEVLGRVNQKINDLQADRLIILHNHPTGSVKPSEGDIQSWQVIRRNIPSNIELIDIVTDGKEYGIIDENGKPNVFGIDEKHFIASEKQMNKPVKFRKMQDAVSVATLGAAMNTGKDFAVVIFEGADNSVMSIQEVPYKWVSGSYNSPGGFIDYIISGISEYGGQYRNVFIDVRHALSVLGAPKLKKLISLFEQSLSNGEVNTVTFKDGENYDVLYSPPGTPVRMGKASFAFAGEEFPIVSMQNVLDKFKDFGDLINSVSFKKDESLWIRWYKPLSVFITPRRLIEASVHPIVRTIGTLSNQLHRRIHAQYHDVETQHVEWKRTLGKDGMDKVTKAMIAARVGNKEFSEEMLVGRGMEVNDARVYGEVKRALEDELNETNSVHITVGKDLIPRDKFYTMPLTHSKGNFVTNIYGKDGSLRHIKFHETERQANEWTEDFIKRTGRKVSDFQKTGEHTLESSDAVITRGWQEPYADEHAFVDQSYVSVTKMIEAMKEASAGEENGYESLDLDTIESILLEDVKNIKLKNRSKAKAAKSGRATKHFLPADKVAGFLTDPKEVFDSILEMRKALVKYRNNKLFIHKVNEITDNLDPHRDAATLIAVGEYIKVNVGAQPLLDYMIAKLPGGGNIVFKPLEVIMHTTVNFTLGMWNVLYATANFAANTFTTIPEFLATNPLHAAPEAIKMLSQLTKWEFPKIYGKPDPEIKSVLDRGVQEGVITFTPTQHVLGGRANRFEAISLAFGTGVERFNRAIALTTLYSLNKRNGMGKAAAYDSAAKGVNNSQSAYTPDEMPRLFGGVGGRAVFTFVKFFTNMFELQAQYLARAVKGDAKAGMAAVTSFGMLLLISGLKGLPLSGEIDKLIDRITGVSPLYEASKRLPKWMVFGMFSWFGVDVTRRFGVGDTFPYLQARPLPWNLATNLFKGIDEYMTTGSTELLQKAVIPGHIYPVIKKLTTNKDFGVNVRGERVAHLTKSEEMWATLGFYPLRVSQKSFAQYRMFRESSAVNERVGRIYSSAINQIMRDVPQTELDKIFRLEYAPSLQPRMAIKVSQSVKAAYNTLLSRNDTRQRLIVGYYDMHDPAYKQLLDSLTDTPIDVFIDYMEARYKQDPLSVRGALYSPFWKKLSDRYEEMRKEPEERLIKKLPREFRSDALKALESANR